MENVSARRFPLPPDEAMDADQRRLADQLLTASRGSKHGPLAMLIRSPAMCERLRPLISYFALHSALPKRLGELAILIQSVRWKQGYEFWAHHQLGLDAGLAVSLVDDLKAGRRPAEMTEDEAAIYDFCMTLSCDGRVDDARLAAVRAHLDDRQIVEIVTLGGVYATLAWLLNLNEEPAPADDTPTPAPGIE